MEPQQAPRYSRLALCDYEGLIQGPPVRVYRGALEGLLRTTMEAMDCLPPRPKTFLNQYGGADEMVLGRALGIVRTGAGPSYDE